MHQKHIQPRFLLTNHSWSVLQSFLYLEAFESNTTYNNWLNWFSQSEVVLLSNLQNLGERDKKNALENV